MTYWKVTASFTDPALTDLEADRLARQFQLCAAFITTDNETHETAANIFLYATDATEAVQTVLNDIFAVLSPTRATFLIKTRSCTDDEYNYAKTVLDTVNGSADRVSIPRTRRPRK